MTPATAPQSRTRLLEAGSSVIRAKGYTATTVDDICAEAGLTKGSFFHHFKSKEDLVLGAVAHWNQWTEAVFADAGYRKLDDPLDRILGYVDFRATILDREIPQFTCLLGTLVQETYVTHPAVREACDRGMSAYIDGLTCDLDAAKRRYAPKARWSAESLGYFIQAALQGSFIFAKAKHDAEVARHNLAHLKRYLISLFPTRSPRR
ncbi:MAG: TetR/AcrR family transcriptional regulator [Alphaproteobacteria bacterium]|nr:TetR/AcrR family transcriptional regulator [Alphaproteobacteria bacterium]